MTAPAGERKPSRGRLAGLLLGLLPLLALLLVSEAALWLAGAGDPGERRALRAGFDDQASYFVPDPDVPGGWRTQMYVGDNEQHPEVIIPPKSARLRVLLFGGSNTEGFPTEFIRQQLQAALATGDVEGSADVSRTPGAPLASVEVINLGRHGYGSERIAILFRQAFVLQPDVVFLYMGHNEFVERGFAMELAQQWSAPWQSRLADGLAHLRTLNVAVEALRQMSAPGTGAGRTPEARADRGPEFDALQHDQTEIFFDVYRQRYEGMLALAAEAGVPVLISTVIGNDFDPPCRMNFAPKYTQAQIDACLAARGLALECIPPRYLPGLIQTRADDPVIHLRPTNWGESLSAQKQAARRKLNAGTVPPTLRTLLPPLDHGPFWTDPALWDAETSTLLGTFAAVVARAPTELERLALVTAAERFEEARKLAPEHAFTLFEQGLCVYLLGGTSPRAEKLLREAARADCSPTRGNDLSNDIVRQLADAHPECAFVDAEAWMRSCFPDRLIGYEVMMDNCHMHARVLPFVMDRFVPPLAALARGVLAERQR